MMMSERLRAGTRINETSRLFIALPLPDAAREQIDEVRRQLKPHGWPVKWVDPGLAHMTLKFLGDTNHGKIRKIEDRLGDISASSEPFSLSSARCGAFPSLDRPQVLWIGLAGQRSRAIDLAGAIDQAMSTIEFAPERRSFRPHITIGRVRRGEGLPQDAARVIERVDMQPVSMTFDRFQLVRSVLGRSGPAYTTLAEWQFGSAAARRIVLVEHG